MTVNTPIIDRPERRARSFAFAALLLVIGVAGCQDPFKIRAKAENVDTRFELWALTGAPVAYPSGLVVPLRAVVRVDAAGSFDLAFDINAEGRLVVLPVSVVVSPIAGSRQIGLQRAATTYSSVAEAPRTGWTNDSSLVLNQGQTFLAKVNTILCQYELQQVVYAKFYVDSIIPDERRVKLIGRVNSNCGFRSLELGLPTY